jgi:Domain of unknown function (DUF4388)
MTLEGNLQDMSLADLIQVFRMGPKTGVLLLGGGLERGVIYVSAGRLIDAVLVRGPERQVLATGEEAVLQLLQWEDATFTFRHDLAAGERSVRIVHDSEWLVLEGMRRRTNPLRVLPHQCITPDTQLELTSLPGSAETGVNLNLDQWRILSQVSVYQNVRAICEKTDMAPEQAIRMVTELVAIGLVEIAAPPAPTPARPPKYPEASHRAQPLQPNITGNGTKPETVRMPTILAGRGLLNAIMRRVRGL